MYLTDNEAFMNYLYKYNCYYHNYIKIYSETTNNENSNHYELQQPCEEKDLIFYSAYNLKNVLSIALDEAQKDRSDLKNEFQEWLYWNREQINGNISDLGLKSDDELKKLLTKIDDEIEKLKNYQSEDLKKTLNDYHHHLQASLTYHSNKPAVIKNVKDRFISLLAYISRNQYHVWFDANKAELEQNFNDLCKLETDDSFSEEWRRFKFAMKDLKDEKIKKINIMLVKIGLEQKFTMAGKFVEGAENNIRAMNLTGKFKYTMEKFKEKLEKLKKILNNPRQAFNELATWVKNNKLKTVGIVFEFAAALVTVVLFPPVGIPVFATVTVAAGVMVVADKKITKEIIHQKAMENEKVKEAIERVKHCEGVLERCDNNNNNKIFELKTNLNDAQIFLEQTYNFVKAEILAEKDRKEAKKAIKRLYIFKEGARQAQEEWQKQIAVKDEEIKKANQAIDKIRSRIPNNEISEITFFMERPELNGSRGLTTFQSDGVVKDSKQIKKSETILRTDLVLSQELGRGGFGVVFKGTWNEKEIAIKQLHMTQPSQESMTQFQQEAEIMAQLDDPNIVHYYGICVDKIPYCIVMEYMPLGSLYCFLHDSSQQLDWHQRQQIMEDIARGLACLHDKRIIHRDLKSLNVLLKVENNQLRAKLSDFGLAKIKTETRSTSTRRPVGSPAWMAPELLVRQPQYTPQSDMYSYGMTVWEIVTRKRPFLETDPSVIIKLVGEGEREEIPQDCPPKIANLIRFCWQKEAANRPSAVDAIQQLQAEETPAATTNSTSSSGYYDNFHSRNN
jgi:Protein tyrosine and serine/threonine kinase